MTTLDTARGASPGAGPSLLARAAGWVLGRDRRSASARWDARFRVRRRLAALPDAVLRDAGLTRADAEAEAAKPFWRP